MSNLTTTEDPVKRARELVHNKSAPLYIVPHPNWKNAHVRLSHNPDAQWTDFGYVGTVVNEYAQLFACASETITALADECERLRKHIDDLNHDFESSSKFCDEHHVLGVEQ